MNRSGKSPLNNVIATAVRSATLAVVAAFLFGFASSSIPKDYTGPVSRMADSFTANDRGGVDFFFLDKIDGRSVYNGFISTLQANAGRGFEMDPVQFSRDVPARSATFRITARTHFAAPIMELTKKVYQVSGDVNFTPLVGHLYAVKGVLSASGSSVWIEDEAGNIMDKKIELKKSTLGLLEK